MMQFELNRRTLQMQPRVLPKPSSRELMAKVKRACFTDIRTHGIKDEEIQGLIDRIQGGIRNTMYLVPTREQWKRLRGVTCLLLRETD